MRFLNWILIIVCVLNSIIIDIMIFFNKRIENANFNNVNNVLDILEFIVIFINLLFVFWVYFRDEKKDKLKTHQEKKNYWYHDVLIQNNIKIVQELFSVCISVSDEIENEDIKYLLRKIKDKKKEVDNGFGYFLEAYNTDLNKQFNDELMVFEDKIYGSLAKLSIKEILKEDYIANVKECEMKLIGILMNHDFEICDK